MPIDVANLISSNLVSIGLSPAIPASVTSLFNGKIPVIFDIPGLSLTIPPLVMYLNPEDISISRKPDIAMVATATYDVAYYYGTDPTDIAINGHTGLFFHPNTGMVDIFRYMSPAYKFFSLLFEMYRNNGTVQDTNAVVMFWRPITLTYEDRIYKGFFKDFRYSESGETPYGFKYSINFTALGENFS
jgi:hypothetical protein